jgi:hypothetical protein
MRPELQGKLSSWRMTGNVCGLNRTSTLQKPFTLGDKETASSYNDFAGAVVGAVPVQIQQEGRPME